MTTQEISSALNKCALLRGCKISPEQMTARTYRGGQIISDQADGRSSVGLVVSGQVDVYSVAMDGRDVQLNALKPGDCFGISNLLLQTDLETVLRCRIETDLVFIPKEALITAMEQDASLAMRYAAHCNQKIQFLIHRIELLTIQSCRGKLIEYLLSQEQSDDAVYPNCSREDLACRLGVSRSALFRELSYLQNRGLLSSDGSAIVLLDKTALEQLLYQRSDC